MEYVTKEFERGKDIAFINMREEELIKSQHKRLLQDMMDNKVRVEDIKSSFFAYDGILHLNLLSLKNLDYLDNFYERILKKFGTYGEDAFLREQLSWLNKTENEIDEIIFYANKSKYEISREKVIRTLEEVCDRKMNKEEFLELKNSIAKDLLELVEHVGKEDPDYEKYVSLCKKNERPISDKFMDYLRNNCDIPFCIKRGSCTVTRAIE